MDSESILNLENDEPAVIEFLREHGGELARDDNDRSVYWLTLRPSSSPKERYYVRLQWDAYPYLPPSVKFADALGGRVDITGAWPVIPAYRPGSFDICQPFTKEGFALHPEWVQGPNAWQTNGNPFLWVVEGMLQFALDNQYQGRSA